MTREKAPYRGRVLDGRRPEDIPDELREKLRKFCPKQHLPDSSFEAAWAELAAPPEDAFVEEIISAILGARDGKFFMEADSTKGEMRAECADILRILRKAEKQINAALLKPIEKLKEISADVDRFRPIDSDEVSLESCMEPVTRLIIDFEHVSQKIEDLPKSDSQQKEHTLKLHLAIDVLRILKKYGIKASVYASREHNKKSTAVAVLQTIGNFIEWHMHPTTWRDFIREAREHDPDLASEPE